MTGMKEGAGEDPFADDETDTGDSQDIDPVENKSTSTGMETPNRQQASGQRSVQIPYKFRRDGVQDGRDRVPLFLQADTKSAERDALRELEDRFGDNVALTDLREALVKVGLDHLTEVEGHLEEWGYGMTFDD